MKLFIGTEAHFDDWSLWNQAFKKLKQNFSKRDFNERWTPLENYHLTLAFLGECSESLIDDLKALMTDVGAQHSPIKLKAKGIGAFPDLRSARVLWIGVQYKKNLHQLYQYLWLRLSEQGFIPPQEEFIPHLTIGRLRNPHSVQSLISPFIRKEWGDLNIDKLTLFKSEVFGNFPKYTSLFSLPLSLDTK